MAEELLESTQDDDQIISGMEPDAAPPEPTPEVESPPASTPPVEPLKAPPRHQHPKMLVRQALEFGATQAQIDATSTDDLDEWVYWNNQKVRSSQGQVAAADVGNAEVSRQPVVDDDDAYLGQLEKEGSIDPKVAAIIRKTKQQAEAASKEVLTSRQAEERRQQAEVQRIYQMVDDVFTSLPEKYHKYFGKGPVGSVSRSAAAHRQSALMHGQVDLTSHSPAVVRSLIEKAAMDLFPDEAPEAPPAGAVTKDEWNKAGLVPPDNRSKASRKGRERAEAAAEKWFKDNGFSGDKAPDELAMMPE